jgi:hypothetical protein
MGRPTKARAHRKIPHRNKSPHGWWIAAYVERFEYDDEDKRNGNRRCFAWENTIILSAKDRDRAYEKAVQIGRRSEGHRAWNADGREGQWKFEGLTSLVPIYEELVDGAEVLWREHKNVAVKTVRSLVPRRKELEVFDDTPAPGDLVGANRPPLQPTRAAKPKKQRNRRVSARAAERRR